MSEAVTTNKSLSYRIGMVCIGLSIISPLLALFVPLLGLSAGVSATLVGVLLLGGPEVFLVLGAILAGKEAVQAIKSKVMSLFKREGPPRPVSRARYNFGLILLVASLVATWILAYAGLVIDVELTQSTELIINAAIDAVVIVSFFILGEQFWEKLKRLFTWEPAAA